MRGVVSEARRDESHERQRYYRGETSKSELGEEDHALAAWQAVD
jgi:hypothetical protein